MVEWLQAKVRECELWLRPRQYAGSVCDVQRRCSCRMRLVVLDKCLCLFWPLTIRGSVRGVSDLIATTTMSASSRTKTMEAQIGATIQSRLMPARSISDSTTSLALNVATVGSGAGNL